MDDQRALTTRRDLRIAWLLAVLAALIGLGLIAVWGGSDAPRLRARAEPAPPSLRETEPSRTALPSTTQTAAPVLTPAAALTSRTHDFEHPHPITPDHERNFRQVDLLDDASKALKSRDFRKARELVATHRAEYPGHWEDMNEGLELLADCMERRDDQSVARAREFYERRTASRVRRQIRRWCLEASSEPDR